MSTILILDFDGTITTQDTISVLATSALTFGGKPISEWDSLVTAYTTDYNTYISQSKNTAERSTLEDEIGYLRGLRLVETASFSRVSSSKIFAGITSEEWRTLAAQAANDGEVVLRDGFERLKSEEIRWGVLSVNFSSEWIRGIAGVGEEVQVIANSVDEEGIIRGPNVIQEEVMATCDGKLKGLRELVKSLGGNGMEKVIYVGDSGTDLECLVEDGIVGVVMSTDGESSLMKTLARIGVDVRYVKDYDIGFAGLYWVRDFVELLNSPLFK